MLRDGTASRVVDSVFGIAVLLIGVLNLWLVHPVPGVVGVLLSLVYVPALRRRFDVAVPVAVRIAIGVAVLWFTLGVSDLGDMID